MTVARASGNGRLGAIVERLLDDSERAIGIALRAGAAGGGLRVRGEHEALLDALAAADADTAQRADARGDRGASATSCSRRSEAPVQDAAL